MRYCECACPFDALHEAHVQALADKAFTKIRHALDGDGAAAAMPHQVAVFDIDETLIRTHCQRCRRLLREFTPCQPVVQLFRECCSRPHIHVHLVTSRYDSGDARQQTLDLIRDQCRVQLRSDHLHMRKDGDHRPGTTIKAELRAAHLPPHTPVLLAVGDQPGDLDPHAHAQILLPNPAYAAL